ncbi:hypothetical protein M427DRAFT_27113 [Gonapodya prolifera JEL478]|uniref:Uncharacterized protein n=1 Tax=Gonapodya prolifera (strain JEL478) TaxID=1344416 RepID=A0A139AXL1_GONPJ|nr:hypothetical protein M427DRAFT_27113 [Gonapodya prolifera JEL478]|eukprot:KXS21447.1 hypothetical protein M427DRAFT_27113 [Gonapodya prolifera JEL478]
MRPSLLPPNPLPSPSTSLPTLEQSFNSSFKTAASTITQLYVQGLRTNKLAYQAGYAQALLDVWSHAAHLAAAAATTGREDEMDADGDNGTDRQGACVVVNYADLAGWIKRRYDEGGGAEAGGGVGGAGLSGSGVDRDDGRVGMAGRSQSPGEDDGQQQRTLREEGPRGRRVDADSMAGGMATSGGLGQGSQRDMSNAGEHGFGSIRTGESLARSMEDSPPDLVADFGDDESDGRRHRGGQGGSSNQASATASASVVREDDDDGRASQGVQALSSLSISPHTSPPLKSIDAPHYSTSSPSARPTQRRFTRPNSNTNTTSTTPAPNISGTKRRHQGTTAPFPLGPSTTQTNTIQIQVPMPNGFSFLGKTFCLDSPTAASQSHVPQRSLPLEGPALKRGRWGGAASGGLAGVESGQDVNAVHDIQPHSHVFSSEQSLGIPRHSQPSFPTPPRTLPPATVLPSGVFTFSPGTAGEPTSSSAGVGGGSSAGRDRLAAGQNVIGIGGLGGFGEARGPGLSAATEWSTAQVGWKAWS